MLSPSSCFLLSTDNNVYYTFFKWPKSGNSMVGNISISFSRFKHVALFLVTMYNFYNFYSARSQSDRRHAPILHVNTSTTSMFQNLLPLDNAEGGIRIRTLQGVAGVVGLATHSSHCPPPRHRGSGQCAMCGNCVTLTGPKLPNFRGSP